MENYVKSAGLNLKCLYYDIFKSMLDCYYSKIIFYHNCTILGKKGRVDRSE